MPAGLTENIAPLVERGQNVLDGAVEVVAGTRLTRLKGLVATILAAMPPGTFLANLYDTSEPGRPFDAATIAGDGLTYDLNIKNGPFPETVAEAQLSFPTSVTVVSVPLPIPPKLRDRVIIATQHNSANTVTTPSGYTLLSHVALAASDVNVYERILTGTEARNVSITASVAGAVLVKVWVIRYSNETIPSEVVSQSNTSTGGTSNDVGSITPSWGVANDLLLTFIGIEQDDPSPPNVTAFPTSFVSTGELQNVSATASLDGAIAWGQLQSRITSFDPTAYTYAASRSAAFLVVVPPRESGAINALPGGSAGWDDVLLNDNHSGASNPIVDDAQYLQFGVAAPPASGQIRTSEPWEARGDNNMDITAGEDINLIAFDSSQFRVTAGALSLRSSDGLSLVSDSSFISANASTTLTLISGTNMTFTPSGFLHMGDILLTDNIALNTVGVIDINSGTDVINLSGNTGINATTVTGSITLTSPFVFLPTGFLKFAEVAASTPSMSAGQALFWVKNDTPNNPFFTDDTNADRQIATFPIPLSGFATIGNDTFLGNVSGSTAAPVAVGISTLAGAGLLFGSHTLDVTAGAGGSLVVTANDIQRAALTGAITASQDSNTTAFGALAAKSVLANATNGSAVPAALAGSAAFQHLRVNSANTGLEWSVFTTGDFPAASVPITALATIATDTFLANVTAGTATPTAVNISTLAGAGLLFGTHTLDVTAGAGGSLVVGANDIQRAALTGVITAAQDSNTTAFATFANDTFLANVSGGVAAPSATNISTLAGAGLVFGTHTLDVTAGAGGSIVVAANDVQRGALTGAITATQDSNTTAFGVLAAKSVLANATNSSAVPAALAGSAAFQHLRVNSANTGLEWSVFTTGDFPSNSVPVTALATIATDTLLANITAGTATPTAVAFTTIDSTSIVWDATTHTFQLGAASGGDITRAQNSVTYTINNDAVTYAKMQNVSATSRFLGRITAGAGDTEELTGTQATTLLDNFTSTLKGLAPLSGGGTVNFLRADGTWAAPVAAGDGLGPDGDKGDITVGGTGTTLTIDAGVVTSAKMANMAAKSVKGNATNSSTVPTDIAGSAAFQHLRVNSANTGLEWSVFTSGDFPAGVVALTAIATQAANTIVANATAGVASPTAIASNAEGVLGRTSGNIQSIDSAVQTALIRGAGSVFWGAAAADQVLRRSGSGDLGFGTLVTNNIGSNQITLGLMAQVATAKLLGRTTAATGNVEALTLVNSTTNTWNVSTGGSISVERAALTGLVTAAANSNVTTIANNAVTNAMLAVATASTIKGNITGSVAVPTDNTLSDTLDALVGTNERNIIARSASGWANTFQTDALAYLNLPTAGGGCTVPFVDEDFDHLVVVSLGVAGFTDVFVAATNGSGSAWQFGAASGTTTANAVGATNGHRGIVQVQTGIVSGNDCDLFMTSAVRFDRTVMIDAWVKLSAITTETFRVGTMQFDSAASGGTDSAIFTFDPAVNANIQCITRASSVSTTTTTGVAGATSWKKYTIWRESSTSVKFYINNTLVATHTTNIPSILMFLGVYLKTNAASARILQVDRIRLFADDATLLT